MPKKGGLPVRAKAAAKDGGGGAGCSDDSKGICLRRKGCECVDCREVGAIETDLQQERLRASMRLLEQEHEQHASAPGELLPHATTSAHTCLVIVPTEEPDRVEEHTPSRAASAAGVEGRNRTKRSGQVEPGGGASGGKTLRRSTRVGMSGEPLPHRIAAGLQNEDQVEKMVTGCSWSKNTSLPLAPPRSTNRNQGERRREE